jgi:ankyrin repeat protein
MTELHKAAAAGDMDAARAILAVDPYRVSEREDYKLTALHRAAAAGHGEMTELLLRAGAAADARDYGGQTPLHAAADGGHAAAVEALLGHRARSDLIDEVGDTPLHKAARGGHHAAARLLLDHRADPNIRGECGGTALHAAAGAGRLQMAELLLGRGALANAHSTAHSKPWTPWNEARGAGHQALTDLLLRHGGADRAAGPISIDRAAALGYDGRVEVLLEGDPGLLASRDFLERRTPLHWAAANGRRTIAERLLERGADPTATDKRGKTPADLAAAAGFGELEDLLRRSPVRG